MKSVACTFVVCFAFWIVLSSHWDAPHLVAGGAAAVTVGLLHRRADPFTRILRVSPVFTLVYLPWLMVEIVKSTLQVAAIVINPRLPIDPVVVRLRTSLSSDLAVTTLANSITLTPGTITLEAAAGELVVHALTERHGRDLLEGAMVARIARVFGERS
jgi:multicomponent Na+:H+ antiporter subunit E